MSLIGARTGQNHLGDQWLLAYIYLQPDKGFDKRYFVFSAHRGYTIPATGRASLAHIKRKRR
jgi:hypothetical protein